MKNIKGIIFTVFLCLSLPFVYSQEVPFDQLNLTGSALYAATKIKEKFSNVIFTGGTRTLNSQARAIARNIYRSSNSGWVGATYTDSAFIRKLNKAIIDNWASIKGNEALILQTVNRVFNSDNAGARSMSKHLSGYAFDLRVNCVNYNELNSFVKTLPGFRKFLTQEGGLDVWHIEFNEAPIPADDSASHSNFQPTQVMYAQTIIITLSDDTSGILVSKEADVDTPAWFRSSVELINRPWLVEGEYTGQVSWMSKKDRPGIIIFGGPNNISARRGIFIHIGNFPSNSDGCVVIAGEQIRKLHKNLRNIYGGPKNKKELGTIFGRNFTIRVIDNRLLPSDNNKDNARQTGSLKNGSDVKVLRTGPSAVINGRRGNWKYVSTIDGTTGWCFDAFLKPIQEKGGKPAPKQPKSQNNSSSEIPITIVLIIIVIIFFIIT